MEHREQEERGSRRGWRAETDQAGPFCSGVKGRYFKCRNERIGCGGFGRRGGDHVGCGGARMGVVRSGVHGRRDGK